LFLVNNYCEGKRLVFAKPNYQSKILILLLVLLILAIVDFLWKIDRELSFPIAIGMLLD